MHREQVAIGRAQLPAHDIAAEVPHPVDAPRPVRLHVPTIGVDTALVSLGLNPDGDPVGVSGLHLIMPNGAAAPGKVLPPAPPGTGDGELLSSVPMNGSTVATSDCATAGAADSVSSTMTGNPQGKQLLASRIRG